MLGLKRGMPLTNKFDWVLHFKNHGFLKVDYISCLASPIYSFLLNSFKQLIQTLWTSHNFFKNILVDKFPCKCVFNFFRSICRSILRNCILILHVLIVKCLLKYKGFITYPSLYKTANKLFIVSWNLLKWVQMWLPNLRT